MMVVSERSANVHHLLLPSQPPTRCHGRKCKACCCGGTRFVYVLTCPPTTGLGQVQRPSEKGARYFDTHLCYSTCTFALHKASINKVVNRNLVPVRGLFKIHYSTGDMH